MILDHKGKSTFYQYFISLNDTEKENLECKIEHYLLQLLRKHCSLDKKPKANNNIIFDIKETLCQFEIFHSSQYPLYLGIFSKWLEYKDICEQDKVINEKNIAIDQRNYYKSHTHKGKWQHLNDKIDNEINNQQKKDIKGAIRKVIINNLQDLTINKELIKNNNNRVKLLENIRRWYNRKP